MVQAQGITSLQGWVEFLGQADIPVLRQSQRNLDQLHGDVDSLSARNLAALVMRDPLMTVKLLRYLQQHRSQRQAHEVLQVEQALLLMGVETFFSKVPASPLVEEVLADQMPALIRLLRVLHRSNRAADYAFDWAVRLRDLHFEEVRLAALLHDLPEALMWCYAPQKMLQIHTMQQQDSTLRSQSAQEAVFGFSLNELQRALVYQFELPALLIQLMDAGLADQPRVRNVQLAVNLARHSSQGWEDAALPDDYQDIAALLKMSVDEVKSILTVPAAVQAPSSEN